LFSKVNRLLIEDDRDKKNRGKKTRRQSISQTLLDVTEGFETLDTAFSNLKIVSVKDPEEEKIKLRTLFEHFHDLS